tara:strand:+ start:10789 stop:10995 length:207 start_codon:yes stop_codon:yes gene_type:complete
MWIGKWATKDGRETGHEPEKLVAMMYVPIKDESWGFGACEAKEGVEAALLELQKQVRLKILPTASGKV